MSAAADDDDLFDVLSSSSLKLWRIIFSFSVFSQTADRADTNPKTSFDREDFFINPKSKAKLKRRSSHV